MDLGHSDRLRRLDALAAEYALGTLPYRARRRLDAIARRDPRVATAIRAWEYRLAGLAEAVPAITPAPRVWEGIRQRLGMTDTPGPVRVAWWSSLSLWRGLAAAGFLLAIALGVMLATTAGEEGEAVLAVLAGEDARPAIVASAARGGRTLYVRPVSALAVPPDRALELWALPEGGNPRPLGLLSASGVARLSLPAPAESVLGNVRALAVSIEPPGGSPTGLPTGPVPWTGAVQRMY